MKAQHQINFKRRRPGRPREKNEAKVARDENSLDVTGTQVVVGERELKFARALSDTEKEVRDASLESLRSWLSEHAEALKDSEIDRLWKALFYCVWMTDKRPVITATIVAITDLTDVVGWKFLHGLFRCLVREWFGVDRHRVDKYYELMNAALRKGTDKVMQAKNDKEFVEQTGLFLDMIDETVWSRVPKAGLGVALHILDVYVDKIMRPLLTRGRKLPGNEVHKVFDSLLEKLYAKVASSEGNLIGMGKRIQERVFECLVELVSDADLKVKDQRDMIMRASKRIFASAASKATATELRKSLYDLRVELKAFVSVCDEAEQEETAQGKQETAVGKNKGKSKTPDNGEEETRNDGEDKDEAEGEEEWEEEEEGHL